MSQFYNHLLTNQRALILRKLIHLTIGLLLFMLTCFVEKDILLYLIISGTIFSFLTFRQEKFQFIHKSNDTSLGTLFYPLGILSSYLTLYNLPLYYFQSSLLILSVSDTLANFSGRIKKGNKWFRIFHDKKSLFGTLAFAVSSYLIFKLILPSFLNSNFEYLIFGVLLAVILENAALKGSDNFLVFSFYMMLGTSLFSCKNVKISADSDEGLATLAREVRPDFYLGSFASGLNPSDTAFARISGIFKKNFNIATIGVYMMSMQKEQGQYNLERIDGLVDFATANNIKIHFHLT